jgi:hypothetical protein
MDTNTVEIYCAADGFSRKFDEVTAGHLPAEDSGKRHRNRRSVMPDAEVMTCHVPPETVSQSQSLLYTVYSGTLQERFSPYGQL